MVEVVLAGGGERFEWFVTLTLRLANLQNGRILIPSPSLGGEGDY